MYVIEHALLNLGKNKGRNILLGAIIFAIITATAVALSIYSTAQASIEETRAALQCAVRVAPQRQTQGGAVIVGGGTAASGGAVTADGAQQEPAVSLEQYRSFAESVYLDGSGIKESTRNIDGVDAVYYLKRPDMFASFESEMRNKGLPDNYAAKTDESEFASIAAPVESLKDLSLAFLLIVLALGSVIMVLLSFIAVRERKYEIGVLRAMGMKKKKIALGLWAEIIVITCVCFALGMGAGAVLSQPVSDAVMSGQSQRPDTGSTSLADRISGTDIQGPSMIDVSVSAATALEVFAVSILLASIAGIISVTRITKFEPIKILMERN